MYLNFRLLCYTVLIWHILPAVAEYRSHPFCYYMKDCQQDPPRDGNIKLDPRFLQAAVEARGSDVDKMSSGSSGVNGFYRPRSALARALYEKQHNDRYLQELDQNEVSFRSV